MPVSSSQRSFHGAREFMTASQQLSVKTKLDFPMLYELVMARPLCKLPTETSPVLRKLILILQAPFNTNPACPSLTAFPANSHCHWPGLECVRGRGFYQIDKQGRDHDGFHFKKISRGHPSLLPGIFTMFCEHGK